MIVVVGSGPAGVAYAHALVSRGTPVTMLDAGVEMEPDLRRVLTTMSGQAPAEWSAAAVERIKRPTEASDRAIPLKAAYGSLFPYRHAPTRLSVDGRGVDALPSYAAAKPSLDRILASLRRHRRHLRAMVLTPLLEIGAPGRGYHTGGSFPMRSEQSRRARFDSDRWGRPNGFERVHVVDASVLPSIPSGPITFSVMANAHRIASECLGG